MDSMAAGTYRVSVNVPRAYLGQAELCLTPDAVTLIARPVRHYRAIVVFVVCVCAVLALVGGLLSFSGQLALREPSLSGPALTQAHLFSEGAPILAGVLVALLVGGAYLLLMALRGDPRSMSLPLTGVSVAKRKGRVLQLSAAFDAEARFGKWILVARNGEDADAIESALTGGG